MLPSDVLGVSVFDQRAGEFFFRQGPIFANMVLADEINRTPPKTQAALLARMRETGKPVYLSFDDAFELARDFARQL